MDPRLETWAARCNICGTQQTVQYDPKAGKQFAAPFCPHCGQALVADRVRLLVVSRAALAAADRYGVNLATIVGTGFAGEITAGDVVAAVVVQATEPPAEEGLPVHATQAAIIVAGQAKIDLATVKPSGAGGVIILEDVKAAIDSKRG